MNMNELNLREITNTLCILKQKENQNENDKELISFLEAKRDKLLQELDL